MNLSLKNLTLLAVFIIAKELYADGDYTMNYTVSIDGDHQDLYVDLRVEFDEAQSSPCILEMPMWAPGYYMIMDFPQDVSDFKASKDDGSNLKWEKSSENQWSVSMAGKELNVSYKVHAENHSVVHSTAGNDYTFIAPNGVFMYFSNDKYHRVDVTYVMHDDWKYASTGLKQVGENRGKYRTFTAPDFDVLYDSPILLGNQMIRKFTHEGHDYEFAILTPDGYDETSFEDDFKTMMSQATKLIGGVPYDNYCLIHLGAGGGGLEHLNSQACYTGGSYRFRDRNSYLSHLCFVTHEYFHLYNVKSIRPIELGPFDYSNKVLTSLLWVSEGFTCYYETRILFQAGLIDYQYLLKELSSSIRTIQTHEGRKYMSLRSSSWDIWDNFFSHSDRVISYYDKGPILGMLFDIEIRRLTNAKKGLDDLMRLLYHKYYIGMNRGFTEEEFWAEANKIAGKELATLRRYVDTTDEIDYDPILLHAGLGINHDTWELYKLDKVNKKQLKVRKALIGE